MSTEFQWGLEQCPAPIVTILTGGSLPASSGTFYLQGWNAAGVNVAGTTTISWPANSRLQVSIPPTARTDGTHFDYYSLCFSTDSNPDNGFLVGLWRSYEANQLTSRSLNPIIYSLPEHLAINVTVTSTALLPASLVPGTTRLFQDAPGGTTNYMAYPWGDKIVDGVNVLPASTPGWVWLKIGAANLSSYPIGGVAGIYGCARKVTDIDEEVRLTSALFAPPKYEANLTATRPYVFLQYTNRYGSTINKGTRLTLQPFINGMIQDGLLSNYLICNVMGYVDTATGSLDASSGLGDGASMFGIGDDLPYSYGQGFWTLQKDLPVNHAVVVRVSPRFDLAQLGSRVLPGSRLSVLMQVLPNAGRQSLESKIFDTPQGGLIFKGGENARVLPGFPYSVVVGSCHGKLIKEYISSYHDRIDLYNFVNASNQKITVTKDGFPVNRGLADVPDVEALLAIVGFGVGESSVTWQPFTLAATGGVTVTANYPRLNNEWLIRSNYPDIGGMSCPGGPLFARIYIRRPDGVSVRLPTRYGVLSEASQLWTISDLVGAVILEPALENFGLFSPPTMTILPTTTGTLSAGAYQIGVAWEYDGSIVTSISHDIDEGCVPVMALNLAEISQNIVNVSSPSKIIQKILAFGG